VKNTARRPKITVSADGSGIISQAGSVLLIRTLQVTGLGDHQGPRRGADARLRRRRPGPAGCLGRGDHRHAGPVILACGDAGDRPQGTPAPRRPAAIHRHRRAPLHLLCHQHQGRQLADLELRHRRRARCEDRIRNAKDTGLRNLPLHGYEQNQVWSEIVALACELLAWMQMLALTGPARRREPKRVRLRIFSIAGRLVRGGRRLRPPPAAAPGRTLALGQPDHHCPRPAARPRPRLTSPNRPCDQVGTHQGPWNPAHRRDSRDTRHGSKLKR
jgi:hypothetical protein